MGEGDLTVISGFRIFVWEKNSGDTARSINSDTARAFSSWRRIMLKFSGVIFTVMNFASFQFLIDAITTSGGIIN
jgi:hypothetical protein